MFTDFIIVINYLLIYLFILSDLKFYVVVRVFNLYFFLHCKNIRISADILCRVFHILTEPVPYTLISVTHCNVGPRFIISSIYEYKRIWNLFR